MRERLVELGIWMMRNPRDVAEFAIVFWCVASVIAGLVLFVWARRDTTAPKAPGFRSRRVG
jgi:hypothetical protein